MKRAALCLTILSVVLAAGCEEDHTRVVVEPRADGTFVRTISLWRQNLLAPKEERVAGVAKLYPTRLEPDGEVVRFRGEFREIPPDVLREEETNRGGYDVWRSGPGWVGFYRERRPGPTDLFVRLQKAAAWVDKLSEIFEEVLRQKLEGEAGFDALVEFLRGPFRTDVKEMMFVMATGGGGRAGDDDRLLSALWMVLELAEERGYIDAADLPRLGNAQSARELLLRFVAKKMGRELDDGLRAKLAFLTDGKELAPAFEKAAEKVGSFEKELDPYIEEILQLDLFSSDEVFELALELPAGAEIVHTSGRREKDGRSVEWKEKLDGRAVRSLFHVSFVVPDEAWQRKRLGGVVLGGEKLYDYVIWESGLPADQAAAWRKALEGIQPGEWLPGKLEAIRITPRDPDEEDEAERGAEILLQALRR